MQAEGKQAIDHCIRAFMDASPGNDLEHEWFLLARDVVIPHIESVLSRRFGFSIRVHETRRGQDTFHGQDIEDAKEVALTALASVRRSLNSCRSSPDSQAITNLVGLVRQRTNQRFSSFLMKRRPDFFMARSDMLLLARRRHTSMFSIWGDKRENVRKVFGLLVWRYRGTGQGVRSENWKLFFYSPEVAIPTMLRENQKELERSGVQETGSWMRGSAWHFYLLLTWLGDKVPLNHTARCLASLPSYREPRQSFEKPHEVSPRFFHEDLQNLAAEWAVVRQLNVDYRRAYLLSASNHGVCPLKLYMADGLFDDRKAALALEVDGAFIEELPASLSNRNIARAFEMSESTVHVYRRRVREKLMRARQ